MVLYRRKKHALIIRGTIFMNYCKIIALLLTMLSTAVFAQSGKFTIESNDLTAGSKIATDFTCDGKNVSPELEWKNSPINTKSYALIVSDPDAPKGTFYHWVLYNIPSTTTKLSTGTSTPPNATAGKNSLGTTHYQGPCPPKGQNHRYFFQLTALDTTLSFDQTADAVDLIDAMQNHVLSVAEIEVTYAH